MYRRYCACTDPYIGFPPNELSHASKPTQVPEAQRKAERGGNNTHHTLEDMLKGTARFGLVHFYLSSSRTTAAMQCHLCLGLLVLGGEGIPLLVDTLQSPLAGSLGLCTLGVHLLSELGLAGLLGLGLVDLWESVRSVVVVVIDDVDGAVQYSMMDGDVIISDRGGGQNSRAQQGHACA